METCVPSQNKWTNEDGLCQANYGNRNWNLRVLFEFVAATFNLKKQQFHILNEQIWTQPFLDLWKEKHCHLLSKPCVVCTNCLAMYCLLFVCIRLYVTQCIKVINIHVILQGQFNENGCATIWLNDVNSIYTVYITMKHNAAWSFCICLIIKMWSF